MNGGIVGKTITVRSGIWSINDLLTNPLGLICNVPSQATIWDSLNNGTGRGATSLTTSGNTTNYKEGGSGLNIIKTLKDVNTMESYRDGYSPALNLTGKRLGVLYYVKDTTALEKLFAVCLRAGNNPQNWFGCYHLGSTAGIHTGWQRLEGSVDSPQETTGSPVKTAIDFNTLFVITNNITDTLAEGDLVFDAIYYY